MEKLATHMELDNPGITAEQQLRYAKGRIAALNCLLSDAEKGKFAPQNELQEKLGAARGVLEELSCGRVDTSHAVGGVSVAPTWKGQAVTDMQRRLAQQLLGELNLIDTSLQRCWKKAEQRQLRLSEVEQLLRMMPTKRGSDDASSLEHLETERSSLQYTRNRVRAILQESNSVMNALQDQGRRLEGSESKVADVLESLGVANSTILQILRRNKIDAWLVYGGIALTLFLLYLVW